MNADLGPKQKKVVKELICGHSSSFAWKLVDMLRISLEIMTYKLNVFPDAKSVK